MYDAHWQCHAGCRALVPEECNFGALQPIFLPPSAVSIPRTEVPMEAIIGVHVRPPPSQRDFGCRKCPPQGSGHSSGPAHVPARAHLWGRSVSAVFGAARRRGGWAPARLVLLARRLLPAACSPHGGASPPYSRGTPHGFHFRFLHAFYYGGDNAYPKIIFNVLFKIIFDCRECPAAFMLYFRTHTHIENIITVLFSRTLPDSAVLFLINLNNFINKHK